jgi:hypothetical protein
MVHACACCRLRFATNGELADHVRNEHTEAAPPPGRTTVPVSRHHYPEPLWLRKVPQRSP